jgi:hypothetical protein
MRKRRLRLVGSRRLRGSAGGEELTLREVGTDREHVVACPRLSEDEVGDVAARLREVLDMPERWEGGGEEPPAGPGSGQDGSEDVPGTSAESVAEPPDSARGADAREGRDG